MNMTPSTPETESRGFLIYSPQIVERLRANKKSWIANLLEDEIFLVKFAGQFRLSEKSLADLPAKYRGLSEDDLLRQTGIWHAYVAQDTLALMYGSQPNSLPVITEISVSESENDTFIVMRKSDRTPELKWLSDLAGNSVDHTIESNDSDSVYQHLTIAAILSRFPFYKFKTQKPVDRKNDPVKHVSQQVRRDLFTEIILGRRPSLGLRYLDAAGLLEYFLPELTSGKELSQNRYHAHDIYEHLLRALDGAVEAKDYLRWSALLHDIGKVPTRTEKENGEASFHNHEMFSAKMVVPIMKRLGIPKEIGQKVRFLVRNHMFHYTDEWSDKAVRRFVKKVPREDLQDLIALRLADRKGSGKKTAFPKALQKLIDHIAELQKKENEPKVSDLKINGHDLMQLGIKPGRIMGDLLKLLLAETSSGQTENEAESLRKRAIALHENLTSAENRA